MARGKNKVEFVGRLVNDIELRYTNDGTPVANFRMATPYRKRVSENEFEDAAEFHDLVAFGGLAEVLAEHVVKGQQLITEGFLRHRQWEDDEGNTRYNSEVVLRDMIFGQRPKDSEEVTSDDLDAAFSS